MNSASIIPREAALLDDKAACMVISEEAFVMLVTEAFFKTFTRRELSDTTRSTEALMALSCESREEVDELVKMPSRPAANTR